MAVSAVNDLPNSSASGDPRVSPLPGMGEKHAPASRRLARPARLLKRADFDRVYQQGRRHFGAHLTVFVLARTPGRPRVGLTVSRAMGGAVERNRIKRRLREAARLHYALLPPGVDVVVNPKKSALRVDFAELGHEMARLFERCGRN